MDNYIICYHKNSTKDLSICPGQVNQLPRKEYKTITVKTEAFQKFVKAIREAKKDDPLLDNSTFLNSLVTRHQKTRRLS